MLMHSQFTLAVICCLSSRKNYHTGRQLKDVIKNKLYVKILRHVFIPIVSINAPLLIFADRFLNYIQVPYARYRTCHIF
jgi:hypothetical protein